MHRNRLVLGIGLTSLLLSGQAPAETMLEEILVTASKREQSLQEIPVSIIATTGEKIAEMNQVSLVDMAKFTPNLSMRDGIQGVNTYIRGSGTGGGNPAFEPSVATFIDGAYLGRDRTTSAAFLDVARVEIVRGPQPLFAGQNAVAGAMNIISNRPGDSWDGYIRATVGTDDEYAVEGAVGGPITDKIGFRVAGIWDERGGWVDNPITDVKGNERENEQYRAMFVFDPTDRLSITAMGTWYESKTDGSVLEHAYCEPSVAERGYNHCNSNPENRIDDTTYVGGNTDTPFDLALEDGIVGRSPLPPFQPTPLVALGGNVFPAGGFAPNAKVVGLGVDAGDANDLRDQDGSRYNLMFDYAADGFDFLSQTNYIEFDFLGFTDVDASAVGFYAVPFQSEYDVIQQEFRFTSNTGERFDWMAGLYWQESNFDSPSPGAFAGLDMTFLGRTEEPADYRAAAPFPTESYFEEEAEWLSAYFNLGFQATERLRFEVGARYTEVEKEAHYQIGTGYYEIDDDGIVTALVPLNTGPGCEIGTEVRAFPSPPDPTGEARVCVADDMKNDSVDPQLVVNYDLTEDSMIYARYAKGFKSGGFSVGMSVPKLDDFVYDPEEAETIEAGYRSTWLDGSLQFNATLFYTEYTDLQVSAARPAADGFSEEFLIQNAAESSNYGLEFDGRWAATERLMINFAGSILTSEYDDYPGAVCNQYKTVRDQDGCGTNLSFDAAGRNTDGVNPWSVYVGGRYFIPFNNGHQLVLSADLNVDKFDPENDFTGIEEKRYQNDVEELLNLRLVYGPQDLRWEVAVYANNVTDNRRFESVGSDPLGYAENIQVRRIQGETYGLQMRYNFGQ